MEDNHYVNCNVCDARCKDLERENERQNERLKILEENQQEVRRIALSTERLATNMEKMVEEQRQQGERISKLEEKQDTRISRLEGRDGEKWRSVVKIIGTAILGAAVGALLVMMGLKV